jgi:hypothetical protein
VTELRQNPDTGRLAERIPDEFVHDDRPWFTYWWEPGIGLTVAVLTEDEMDGWVPVEVRPTFLGDPAADERIAALEAAVCRSITFAQIGEQLGITPEQVRELANGDPDTEVAS